MKKFSKKASMAKLRTVASKAKEKTKKAAESTKKASLAAADSTKRAGIKAKLRAEIDAKKNEMKKKKEKFGIEIYDAMVQDDEDEIAALFNTLQMKVDELEEEIQEKQELIQLYSESYEHDKGDDDDDDEKFQVIASSRSYDRDDSDEIADDGAGAEKDTESVDETPSSHSEEVDVRDPIEEDPSE